MRSPGSFTIIDYSLWHEDNEKPNKDLKLRSMTHLLSYECFHCS